MHKRIPLSVPNLCGNELQYVTKAVKDEWVSTGGNFITSLEKYAADYLGVLDTVACQSGTAGLHLSLIQAGVKSNDIVLVPTLTFIATVNPVKYCGADPIFMDCDNTLNMDISKVKLFLEEECFMKDSSTYHRVTNQLIKAIIVVHVFGNLMNLELLKDLCRKYNIVLIEDATEALGSKYITGPYQGRYAGTIGDFGVFSFNGNKIITSGGGGLVTANNSYDLEQIRHLSTQAKSNSQLYFHDEIGYNYRMTNLQAAVALGQFEMLESFITIKKNHYHIYKDLFNKIGLDLLDFNPDTRSNYWFYSLKLKDYSFEKKIKLIKLLNSNGVEARPIWGLIHEQKPYMNNMTYKIKEAMKHHNEYINIPCSTNLTLEEVKYIVKVMERCVYEL